jgi:hypothetical protein
MQFIEVPNVKKNRLRMSDLVIENLTFAQYQANNSPSQSVNSQPDVTNTFRNMTIRSFKTGTVLTYGTWIYNARLNATQKPQLQAQIRLFRGKDLVYSNKSAPLDITNQADMKRVGFTGALSLGKVLPEGDYILQLIVIDTLAKGKSAVIAKTIDFEIVKP